MAHVVRPRVRALLHVANTDYSLAKIIIIILIQLQEGDWLASSVYCKRQAIVLLHAVAGHSSIPSRE